MSADRQPVSPDGMFRWNGERWVPTARRKRQSLLLVLAILCGLGMLLLALMAVVLGPAIIGLGRAFS